MVSLQNRSRKSSECKPVWSYSASGKCRSVSEYPGISVWHRRSPHRQHRWTSTYPWLHPLQNHRQSRSRYPDQTTAWYRFPWRPYQLMDQVQHPRTSEPVPDSRAEPKRLQWSWRNPAFPLNDQQRWRRAWCLPCVPDSEPSFFRNKSLAAISSIACCCAVLPWSWYSTSQPSPHCAKSSCRHRSRSPASN